MRQLFFLLFLFGVTQIQAQQAILASGGNAIGSGGTVTNSIGQIEYITATGTGGTATQGVQQPFEIVTLSGQEFTQISLQMVVYPNPTSSFVNLKIGKYTSEKLTYELFDLNGRQIYGQKISNPETKIEMENLASAIYFLKVSDENKPLKTFKIIKNN